MHFSASRTTEWLDSSIGMPFPLALEMPLPHAQRVGEVLQFAVAVALAGLAVHRMVVEQQFDDIAAGLANGGRVRLHLHPFPDLRTARGHVKAHVLHIDDAHPARTGEAQVGMVAKPRDADPQRLRRLHDRRALGNRNGRIVDFQRDFFLFGHEYIIKYFVLLFVKFTLQDRHRRC